MLEEDTTSRRTILGALGAAALSKIILPWRPKAQDILVANQVPPELMKPEPINPSVMPATADDAGPFVMRFVVPEGEYFHWSAGLEPIDGLLDFRLENKMYDNQRIVTLVTFRRPWR